MHSITGKLNKDARQFQAGDSTGFGIRLGVKYRDPKTKQDEYTNYQAVIFAKSAGQIQFYQSALVAGSVIEVSAEQLKVDTFQGDNGPIVSIDMLNARLGYVHSANAPQGQPAQQQRPSQQQQGYVQQQQQQRPQQRPPAQQQGNAAYQNQGQQSYQQANQAPQQQGMQMPADDGWGDLDIPF